MLVSAVSLVVILLTATFLWQQLQSRRELNAVREALRKSDFAAAQRALDRIVSRPGNAAEVAYLSAVVCRRSGRLREFDEFLEQASRLRWNQADIEHQRLLARAQVGDVDAVHAQLMNEQVLDVSDDTAEETYEAIAMGYLASFQLREAWRCLDYWLRWRPDAPIARLLRASIYERRDNVPSAVEDYRVTLKSLPDHYEARLKLATRLVSLKQIDQAREHFASLLATNPLDPEVLLGLAECDRVIGENATAEQRLQTVLDQPISRSQRAAALLALGQMQRASGNSAEAITTLTTAVGLAPEQSNIHYALARALIATGQTERAEFHQQRVDQIRQQYERLASITEKLFDTPGDADLRFQAGVILIQQGMIEEGLGWMRTALKCDPHHTATNEYLLGRRLFEEGLKAHAYRDVSRIATAADGLARLKDFQPHAALLRGMVAQAAGRLREAIDAYGAARDQPETQVFAYTLSGEVLYKMKQFGDAERLLLMATQLDPLHTDAHRWLAAIYHDTGANDHARLELHTVIEQAPHDPRPHRLMGLMYKDFETYDQAIEQYRLALKKSPNQPDADQVRQELAACLVKERRHEEALEVLKPVRLVPVVLVLQARCHYALGDAAQARRLVGEALRMQPSFEDALELSASIAMDSNDPATAVTALEQAVAGNPKHWPLHYQLSRAYQRLGKTAEAEQALATMSDLRTTWERFTELHKQAMRDPDDARVRCTLGEVALELGKPELAVDWFVVALGLDPQLAEAREHLEALQHQLRSGRPSAATTIVSPSRVTDTDLHSRSAAEEGS
jgi:tetratricopeptide (TPR) repeat protein